MTRESTAPGRGEPEGMPGYAAFGQSRQECRKRQISGTLAGMRGQIEYRFLHSAKILATMVRTIARHGENLRGVKLPTGISLQDIATAVGVSVSTVSRALNDSERVSLVTKQAVQNAIEEIARQRERGDGRATIRPMIGITHSHPSGIEATRGLDVILEQVLAGVEIEC